MMQVRKKPTHCACAHGTKLMLKNGCMRLLCQLLVSFCLVAIVTQLVYVPLFESSLSSQLILPNAKGEEKSACPAPHEGIILLNTKGLLANNLFEVAYAKRLASELCWNVILYRPMWNNELPTQRAYECLPNIMHPRDFHDLSDRGISESLQQILNFNASRWDTMTVEIVRGEEDSEEYYGDEEGRKDIYSDEEENEEDDSGEEEIKKEERSVKRRLEYSSEEGDEESGSEEDSYDSDNDDEFFDYYDEFQLTGESDDRYNEWVEELEEKGLATRLMHLDFDFSGNGTEQLVEQIRSSDIRMVSLEAFFIHYDWMASWRTEIRQWLTMSNSCCFNQPPEDAVVIHVRDFDNKGDGGGIEPSVYTHILKQYDLMDRPLWIVCQPKSANSAYVQEIVNSTPSKSATIVTGRDQYDAICTLTRAKTLLLSAASTFSQMGAMLADPRVEVHFPIPTLEYPRVTLAVPTWKYHLVAESLDHIQEFDINLNRLDVDID